MWIWIHNLTTRFFSFFSFHNGADGQCTGDNTIASYGDLPDLYWYVVGITILSRGPHLMPVPPPLPLPRQPHFLSTNWYSKYQLVLPDPISKQQPEVA
jgi:hypothetical protein